MEMTKKKESKLNVIFFEPQNEHDFSITLLVLYNIIHSKSCHTFDIKYKKKLLQISAKKNSHGKLVFRSNGMDWHDFRYSVSIGWNCNIK